MIDKLSTGIAGFDKVSGGGLPRRRSTLIAGGPGCGKTLFMLSVLAHAAGEGEENAIFLSFEEPVQELDRNAASIGIPLKQLREDGRLHVESIRLPAGQSEVGGFDLDGLIIRIGRALDKTDASIIALDTIETLYSMFDDRDSVRAGLRRLFRWLAGRGVTCLVSAERGRAGLTRFGFEEYVTDCVILLDHRVEGDVSTRILRIIKYRGAAHGTNEFPFLIDDNGFSMMPVTSADLDHEPSEGFVSTGLPGLDEALSGRGLRIGSTALVTGQPGAGKTLLALTIACAACARGERVLYVSFEESPAELAMNGRSIGLDVAGCMDSGALEVHSARPTMQGLETHLVSIYRSVRDHQPTVAVIDPISSLRVAGSELHVHQTLVRLVDMFKERGVTTWLTSLNHDREHPTSGDDVSSIIDCWMHLRHTSAGSGPSKALDIIKSRGMRHTSTALRVRFSDEGIRMEAG